MKGLGHVIWVMITLVLAIIVLVLVIAPVIRGQQSLQTVVGETDYRNCCANFRAANENVDGTICSVPESVDSDGKMSLLDLCSELGKQREYCNPCGV